jgi:transposase
MTTEPYASARRVFFIADNGSSHRGQASVDRMRKAWPTARLVHLPIHASWLNQIEIYFSIIQRKVLAPNDFHDLDTVAERLLGFQDYWQDTGTPFDWKFTRTDLHQLLARIDTHQPLKLAA